MSNYSDNIDLRVDVAALANAAYELREQLCMLERRYFWNSEVLTERLAGQVLSQANVQFLEIYKQLNELDSSFKD